MISFLVWSSKTTEDEDVLVWYLEETASLEADPIRVLFDFQIKRLPLLSTLQVKLLYQISALSSIEASHNIEWRAIESDCGMEVSLCIEARKLSPVVECDIVNLAFIHRFVGQGWTDRKYLTLFPIYQDTSEGMSSSLKKHVSSLYESFLDEFVAELGGLPWFTTASQENAAFLVLDRHEVRWDLNIDHIWSVAMRSEIVHK